MLIVILLDKTCDLIAIINKIFPKTNCYKCLQEESGLNKYFSYLISGRSTNIVINRVEWASEMA